MDYIPIIAPKVIEGAGTTLVLFIQDNLYYVK